MTATLPRGMAPYLVVSSLVLLHHDASATTG
jgi:hypothetical protein